METVDRGTRGTLLLAAGDDLEYYQFPHNMDT
jgi:hypothetical protein